MYICVCKCIHVVKFNTQQLYTVLLINNSAKLTPTPNVFLFFIVDQRTWTAWQIFKVLFFYEVIHYGIFRYVAWLLASLFHSLSTNAVMLIMPFAFGTLRSIVIGEREYWEPGALQ